MDVATLSWIELAAAAAVITAIAGAIAWVVRAEGRSRQNAILAAQAAARAEAIGRELEDHKIADAERYATWDALNRLEDKVGSAIDRLGEQLMQALAGSGNRRRPAAKT